MECVPIFSHPIWFVTSVALLLVVLVVVKVLHKASWNSQHCHVDLTGKTVIVTGANTGIGKCVALDLAHRKARVILACRSRERGQNALEEICRLTGNRDVHLRILDTSSKQSVRSFAEQILKEEKRLDILVNNAGASGLPKTITNEGLEITYATNYLGPFLLTNLLLDLMKKSAPARIVNVSSVMHKQGEVNLKHLNGEDMVSVSQGQAYNNTKLLGILFTRELARKLQGTGVTANCLHPGVVRTEVMRNYSWVLRGLFWLIGIFFFKSPKEGAASTLYCAISEEVEGISGKYFDSDCSLTLPSPTARDEAMMRKLWDVSEQLTGLIDKKEK